MESDKGERARALTAGPVAVIYVSSGEPARGEPACPATRWGGLRAAAAQLHRMADYVDEARRSLERRSP